MITFVISIILLLLGYLFYSKLIERNFGIDSTAKTPAYSKQDGIDYIPMKTWRIFMIQFLNITGLGPIFGAIMGAKFGSASFLWIVFGSIFGGAVHDYLSGMISLRKGGVSLPEIHGEYLGKIPKQFMRFFMVILMILVGVVFVSGPADLLAWLTPQPGDTIFWIILIFIYYVIATLMPVDKIIGRIYPIFGFCLLFMALGILISIFIYQPEIPEIWEGLQNRHPDATNIPIFPMMFVSIACGAVSGFHATQSPLMVRCIKNEKYCRPVFYGSMIVEGVVALIWAAAASYFFFETPDGQEAIANGTSASLIVDKISREWLGKVGAILAIIGVIAAPITTGDTAFRSARLIVADILHIDQKPIKNRLLVAIPLFLLAVVILVYSVLDKSGFDVIWRYFSWGNQVLAAVTLWAFTIYLFQNRKWFITTLLPAMFMTMVVVTYILIAPEGLGLQPIVSYITGGLFTAGTLILFITYARRYSKNDSPKLL